MKVAIVGASGFVGNRMIEKWTLTGTIEPVPVVRAFSSLAVLARFDLPWQVCDLFDPAALAKALAGCEAAVHAAIGDPRQIVQMAEAIYEGAQRAGLRRLVVLSSASVHGQTPAPGTDETSPLHQQHTMAYNTAKVRAEQVLRRLEKAGTVEVVMLRPAIVYGPRSRWIADAARQMRDGTACLVGDGSGICNGIYVDNLIHAIELALESGRAAGETFLVGDEKTVTWREFYGEIAEGLELDLRMVRSIDAPSFPRLLRERVGEFTAAPVVQKVTRLIPSQAKRVAKAVLANWHGAPPSDAWQLQPETSCAMTEELALVQQCRWKLSSQKAETILGYRPEVTFEVGMRRSLEWYRFIGLSAKAA